MAYETSYISCKTCQLCAVFNLWFHKNHNSLTSRSWKIYHWSSLYYPLGTFSLPLDTSKRFLKVIWVKHFYCAKAVKSTVQVIYWRDFKDKKIFGFLDVDSGIPFQPEVWKKRASVSWSFSSEIMMSLIWNTRFNQICIWIQARP